jgi:hypothetical protein
MKTNLLILAIGLFVFSACEKTSLENELKNSVKKSGNVVLNFRSHLSGDQEVPARETQATGQAIFQLSKDGTMLYYKLIVANLDNVLVSHIHLGAAGANGSPVAFLYGPLLIQGTSNGIIAEGHITAANLVGPLAGHPLSDLIENINLGLTYVNVHTTRYPGGEIRGQLK